MHAVLQHNKTKETITELPFGDREARFTVGISNVNPRWLLRDIKMSPSLLRCKTPVHISTARQLPGCFWWAERWGWY